MTEHQRDSSVCPDRRLGDAPSEKPFFSKHNLHRDSGCDLRWGKLDRFGAVWPDWTALPGPIFRAAIVGYGPESAYEAMPRRCTCRPCGGVARSRIATLPLRSGSTWRLDLSRVSQAYPN